MKTKLESADLLPALKGEVCRSLYH